ncbi:hypothetical protein HNP72_001119 [Sphingobacterium soli]|nr:hypothetical protein [Sphingobacterium soli]
MRYNKGLTEFKEGDGVQTKRNKLLLINSVLHLYNILFQSITLF